MPQQLDEMENLRGKHAQHVITRLSDLHTYVALKHAVSVIGYNAEVYLPQEGKRTSGAPITPGGRTDLYGSPRLGGYEPETRTGSLYNRKDHEYLYKAEPDFIARIAILDPQAEAPVRGTQMFLSETNQAYTLKQTRGHRDYCPGDIVRYSKLLFNYGGEDLSYFVKSVRVLRNPNASAEDEEALIRLELVLHI